MQPLGRDAILELVPHQGAMCLWDEVLEWDAQTIQLRAHNHRDAAHPLRANGQLRAVHLCEYGAQAMAVHGGLLAHATGGRAPPGMLVSLRAVAFHVGYVEALDGELTVEAERLLETPASWQYAFRVLHLDRLLAEGRAAVMILPAG